MEQHDNREEMEGVVTRGSGSERGLVAIFAGLCVVAVVLVAAIVVVNLQSGQGEQSSGEEVNGSKVVENDVEREEVSIDSNGSYYDELNKMPVDEYMAEMGTKIDAAETDEEKGNLYLERGSNLRYLQIDEKELADLALKDFYKAEELSPSRDSALGIYHYEEEAGNTERAKEYLQKAIDRGYVEVEGNG